MLGINANRVTEGGDMCYQHEVERREFEPLGNVGVCDRKLGKSWSVKPRWLRHLALERVAFDQIAPPLFNPAATAARRINSLHQARSSVVGEVIFGDPAFIGCDRPEWVIWVETQPEAVF